MFTDNFKSRARVIRELGEQIARLTRERDDARAQRNRLNEANAAFSAQIEAQATALARVTHERDEALRKLTTAYDQHARLTATVQEWRKKYDAAQAELARLKGQDGAQKPVSKRKGKEG